MEEGWRILPPDQRQHALFSETRMGVAKQMQFCGAVAGALLIGVKFVGFHDRLISRS